MRDIIFNKDKIFNGDLDKIKDNCLYIKLDKLIKFFIQAELSMEIFLRLNKAQNENSGRPLSQNDNIFVSNPGDLDKDIYQSEELDKNSLI